jgi:hypothetical protein
MPYDPLFPPLNAPLTSLTFRNQFNGLHDLINVLTGDLVDMNDRMNALQAELNSIPPGLASIVDLQAPDPGTIHLQAAANRATSITVSRQGPSDPDFVVETVVGLTYDASGLESGTHTVKVAGVNPGGTGPESGTTTLLVSYGVQCLFPLHGGEG